MSAPALTMIVGHLTDTSARIWVQGSASHPNATLTVIDLHGNSQRLTRALEPEALFTAVFDFQGLQPDSAHTCLLVLQGPAAQDHPARGGFKTFPAAGATPPEFSFGLVSCNDRSLDTDTDFFQHVLERAKGKARFVIHAGDNIYYDKAPNLGQAPSLQRYADTYNRAWGRPDEPEEDINRSIRALLSETANYMILDDHDITDNFSPTDPRDRLHIKYGMEAYQRFQHAHNPDTPSGRFYYDFSYGNVRFFVMDTRFERREEDGQMISPAQERAFLRWAEAHKDDLKFVVTSVPILCRTYPLIGDANDKWCGKRFVEQRDRVLSTLAEAGIGRLVFLTGDMHASYHLEVTLYKGEREQVYHELMSSPVNHWLRNRVSFNESGRWDVGGWSARAKDFTNFTSQRSAMMITANAASGVVQYECFSTEGRERFWAGGFTP